MGNSTVALVFVIFVNMLMFLAQAAMLDISSTSNKIYNYNESIYSKYDAGGMQLDPNQVMNITPNAEGSVLPDIGAWVTDTLASIKEWFGKVGSGLDYLKEIVMAPYNFLKAMHFPNEFTFAIGTAWYLLTAFIIVSFFWGRD